MRWCLCLSGVNFIGNVEPKDVLQGAADVIVADGFVGNIMLKSLEAVGDSMFRILRHELTSNLLHMLGAFLSRGALRNMYRKVDPFEIGGAPLLGVNGVGHRRARSDECEGRQERHQPGADGRQCRGDRRAAQRPARSQRQRRC